MTELGDRFREFAALCDNNPRFTAAGIITLPHGTIVASFSETNDDPIGLVSRALSIGVQLPLDESPFREVDEPNALSLGAAARAQGEGGY